MLLNISCNKDLHELHNLGFQFIGQHSCAILNAVWHVLLADPTKWPLLECEVFWEGADSNILGEGHGDGTKDQEDAKTELGHCGRGSARVVRAVRVVGSRSRRFAITSGFFVCGITGGHDRRIERITTVCRACEHADC